MAKSPIQLAALLAVCGLGLTACSAAEPHRDVAADRSVTVFIVVDPNYPGQQIMGEVYARALEKAGRNASIIASTEINGEEQMPLDLLRSRQADLVVGCTGDFLNQANPAKARELSERAKGGADELNPNDPSFNIEVFEAFRSSLPSGTESIDPSGAEGCRISPTAKTLPQQMLPVFRSSLFNRDELMALDIFNKRMTTKDLEELSEEVEHTGSVEKAVSGWIGTNDPGSELEADTNDTEGDSEFGIGESVEK